MAITDKDYIKQLGIGYDMDGAGYTWAAPTDCAALEALPVVVWSDPDLDYIASDACPKGHSADLLVFAPNSGHFPAVEYPEEILIASNDGHAKMKRIAVWNAGESDHACNCHGKFVETSEAAGEPQAMALEEVNAIVNAGVQISVSLLLQQVKVGWEYTGNSADHCRPDCDRCEGDGYVKSSGGEFALYEWDEEWTDDEPSDDELSEDAIQEGDPGDAESFDGEIGAEEESAGDQGDNCGFCAAPTYLLGVLGTRYHYKCRYCGIEHSELS